MECVSRDHNPDKRFPLLLPSSDHCKHGFLLPIERKPTHGYYHITQAEKGRPAREQASTPHSLCMRQLTMLCMSVTWMTRGVKYDELSKQIHSILWHTPVVVLLSSLSRAKGWGKGSSVLSRDIGLILTRVRPTQGMRLWAKWLVGGFNWCVMKKKAARQAFRVCILIGMTLLALFYYDPHVNGMIWNTVLVEILSVVMEH